MAAEMSSGLIAMMHTHESKPSISMLVTNLEAEFVKKATGVTTFTCEDGKAIKDTIEKAIATGEGQSYTCTAIGKSENGEIEAIFKVQWSFKARKS
jgi:deoxyribose-phosphate aldolase